MPIYVDGKEVGYTIVKKDLKLPQVLNKTVTSLTSDDLAGATQIPRYAFENCTSLASVELPDTIVSIGNYAFQSCSNLTTINLSEGISEIGISAFQFCRNLTEISMPSSVTFIGSSVFYSCTDLNTVTFQGQVPNIRSSAFNACYSVTKYDFRNCTVVPTLANTDSLDHANNCQIIVPDALYDEWTQATNWVALTNVVWVKASEYTEEV